MFKYRPYIDVSVNEHIHRQFEDPYRYINNPFSFAVDNSDHTAYKSTRPIATGDYIGIDMLLNVNRKIEFRLLFQMGDSWINNIKVEIAGPDAVYVSTGVFFLSHSHPCDLILYLLSKAKKKKKCARSVSKSWLCIGFHASVVRSKSHLD